METFTGLQMNSKFFIAIFISFFAFEANAQLYKCSNNGVVAYQQSPCPGGQKLKELAPPTQDEEFRTRIEAAIAVQRVMTGMKQADVIRSWGNPSSINKSIGSYGVHEQWVYRGNRIGDDRYLYLENGILKSMQLPN
jgi:Domain of unknown function (DUF4124)